MKMNFTKKDNQKKKYLIKINQIVLFKIFKGTTTKILLKYNIPI